MKKVLISYYHVAKWSKVNIVSEHSQTPTRHKDSLWHVLSEFQVTIIHSFQMNLHWKERVRVWNLTHILLLPNPKRGKRNQKRRNQNKCKCKFLLIAEFTICNEILSFQNQNWFKWKNFHKILNSTASWMANSANEDAKISSNVLI